MGVFLAAAVRVDAKAYYDTLPGGHHDCGDVWRNLPSFGLLGSELCTGIVITPACDLSWQKSDTITYLPIVPVRSYFSLDAALPAVFEKLSALAKAAAFPSLPQWEPDAYIAPDADQVIALRTAIQAFRSARQRSAKVLSALDGLEAGLHIIDLIRSDGITAAKPAQLSTFFGNEWSKIKAKIISNSYSPTLHFLPSDGQDPVFSGVRFHSVALFRYPITVPVKVLTYAQETAEPQWKARVQSLPVSKALQKEFATAQPIKLASLRPAFLSDLLTRFAALYNRIGSPDFTSETVASYASEVDQ
jgi:hypothetical protein